MTYKISVNINQCLLAIQCLAVVVEVSLNKIHGHLEADYDILRLLVEDRFDGSVFYWIFLGWWSQLVGGEYWWLPWRGKSLGDSQERHQHPPLADIKRMSAVICWTIHLALYKKPQTCWGSGSPRTLGWTFRCPQNDSGTKRFMKKNNSGGSRVTWEGRKSHPKVEPRT